MSTSRHINKICVVIIAVSLALTLLFMNGSPFGIAAADTVMGYENRLFDTSYVHTLDIVMNDWDEFIETCENEEYSPCAVVIDGESFKNVGIRAKGNTSLSSVRSLGSQRYSFKLEFDQYENGKSYYGLDKLSLNNLIQDNTMMKDYLAYQMMGDFGVDSPLCSFVYITVNGEDWGLYLAVESAEDSFLRRNYGSDSGDLYKPDSLSFGGGRGNGRDFDFGDFDFDNADTWNRPEPPSGFGGSPSGTDSSSEFPQMPGGESFPGGSFPSFPGGNMPQIPDGAGFSFGQGPDAADTSGENMPKLQEGSDLSSQDQSSDTPSSESTSHGSRGGFGGFGGMGSDDVKLKYIDDDPDSYSNIFGNAKTDVTDADKARLIASIKNLNEYTDLENTLDTDEVLRYFVVHNFVCNGDSYTGAMIHNYYLHEKDGQLSMIPWDYNLAFGTFQSGDADSAVNASIDSPVSGGSVDDRPMVGWIFSDETYTEKYHELFSEFIERWFSDSQLVNLIEETKALLEPYVEKDPTKFCTEEEFDAGVETLEQFVTLRAEAVSWQLNGDTSDVDTEGLDLSAMGSMNSSTSGGPASGFGPGGSGSGFPDMQKKDSSEIGSPSETPGNSDPQGTAPPTSEEDGTIPDESSAGEEGGFTPPDFAAGGSGNFPGFSGAQPGRMSPWENGSGTGGGNSANSQMILLAVSCIILLIGLVIAARTRH